MKGPVPGEEKKIVPEFKEMVNYNNWRPKAVETNKERWKIKRLIEAAGN